MLRADVIDERRIRRRILHRRRAPLPGPPGRFAAAGSGDRSAFAGVWPSSRPSFASTLVGVNDGDDSGGVAAPANASSWSGVNDGSGVLLAITIVASFQSVPVSRAPLRNCGNLGETRPAGVWRHRRRNTAAGQDQGGTNRAASSRRRYSESIRATLRIATLRPEPLRASINAP